MSCWMKRIIAMMMMALRLPRASSTTTNARNLAAAGARGLSYGSSSDRRRFEGSFRSSSAAFLSSASMRSTSHSSSSSNSLLQSRHRHYHHHQQQQQRIRRMMMSTTSTTASKERKSSRDRPPSPAYAHRVILLRHGESTWNKENRYIGWTDVPLTEAGEEEAKDAGEIMREAGLVVDRVYTSYLKRAIKTAWIALEGLNQIHIPMISTWELNERMYGLAGLLPEEAIDRYGKEQVGTWARSFDQAPPAVEADGPCDPRVDIRRYGSLDPPAPQTEALKDAQERVVRYWQSTILPQLRLDIKSLKQKQQQLEQKQYPLSERDNSTTTSSISNLTASITTTTTTMIVSHANTMRALMAHIDHIGPEEVWSFEVPRAVPIIYHFDVDFRPIRMLSTVSEVDGSSSPYLPLKVTGSFLLPHISLEDIEARLASNS